MDRVIGAAFVYLKRPVNQLMSISRKKCSTKKEE